MSDHPTLWLSTIQAMTGSEELAQQHLDRRLKFTTAVATELVRGAVECPHVVYGVWLKGHDAPVYIGQTTEGPRRLWDLPIGESHHLGNSFPPEIWHRVVVVHWGGFLNRDTPGRLALMERLQQAGITGEKKMLEAVGLGLEHRLQALNRPLMNRRTKRRDGTWRSVDWLRSRSVGAQVAPLLDQLFVRVEAAWSALGAAPPTGDGRSMAAEGGIAVFPALLHASLESRPGVSR